MADNDLKIRIGADLSALISEITGGTSVLQKFGQSATKNLDGASRALDSIKKSGAGIAQSLGSIPAALAAIGDSNAGLQKVNQAIQDSSDKAIKSGKTFQEFGDRVSNAIAQIGANGQGILQVTAAINDVATAARNAGEGFLAIGLTDPIAEINLLKTNVAQLKNELETGFKPIVSIVDPNTPKLLNSFSASLTNISPAVQAANNALRTVGDSTKIFAVTINKSLADAVRQFDQFRIEATGLSGAFDKIPSSLRPFNTSSLVALRTAVSGLKKDVVLLNSQPLTLPGLARGATEVQRQFQKANPVINSFNQLLREAPAFTYSTQTGILALSNNIPIFLDSFKNARQAGQGFFSILGTLGKSLFSFGSLATIAVSAATIFGDKIFGASKQTKEATDTLEKFKQTFGKAFVGGDIGRAKQEIELYQSSLKSAIESTAQESSKVALIVDRLKESNTSRAETVGLIEQLKKLAPDYFGKLDAEKSKIGDVVTAYNNYNNALVRNVEAQVKVAELTDVIRKRLEIQATNPEANKFLQDQIAAGKSFKQIAEEISKQRSSDTRLLTEQIRSGKAITDEQLKQTNAVKGNSTEVFGLLNLLLREKGILESINNIDTKTLGIDLGDTKKEDAELKSLKDNLAGVSKELQIINELRKEGKIPIHLEDDAIALEQSIADIKTKIGKREVVLKLKTQIDADLDNKLIDVELKKAFDESAIRTGSEIKVPVIVNPLIEKDSFNKALGRAIAANDLANAIAGIDLKLPINVTPIIGSNVTKAFTGLIPESYAIGGAVGKAFSQGVSDGSKDLKKTLAQINKEFEATSNQILNQTIVNLGVNLGTALGEAIGSGQKFDGISVLLKTLGEALQEMGKALIVAGVAKLQIDKALSAFGGPGMIAAGVLSVALGALIKSKINKIPKFAEGGIVTGPTFGLVGEAGKEAIIPLNRLNEFLLQGSQDININLRGVVEGRNIKLVYDREARSQERIF